MLIRYRQTIRRIIVESTTKRWQVADVDLEHTLRNLLMSRAKFGRRVLFKSLSSFKTFYEVPILRPINPLLLVSALAYVVVTANPDDSDIQAYLSASSAPNL